MREFCYARRKVRAESKVRRHGGGKASKVEKGTFEAEGGIQSSRRRYLLADTRLLEY